MDIASVCLGNTMGMEGTLVKPNAQFSSNNTIIKFLVKWLNQLEKNADNQQSFHKG